MTAVIAWLDEHGLSATLITPADDWLSIDVPASKANELFEAEFSTRIVTREDRRFVRFHTRSPQT